MQIDRCERSGLARVRELAGVIWRRHYPGIITHEQIDYMLARGYSEEALASFLAPPNGLAVARLEGEAVGFAAWCATGEPKTVKLDKLYVLQEHHGQGVGRALIQHVEREARRAGAERLVLNVNKHNEGSIAAYRHCGFDVREAVVVDIGQGFVMDDYVMEKSIESRTGN